MDGKLDQGMDTDMTIVQSIRRYKYLPYSCGSLQIIKDGTMKFTRPSKVNDPFDCAPDFDTADLKKHIMSRPELLNMSNCLEHMNDLKVAIDKGLFNQVADESIGICSLSRDPLNLLMWAHYAEHHKGFVIEFDIPVSVEAEDEPTPQRRLEWLVPCEVKYEDSKPVVTMTDSKEEKLRKQFLVKGTHWLYEQEERTIDHIRGAGIHSYDRKTILCSVIAGMKMEERDCQTLLRYVKQLNSDMNMNIQVHKTASVKGRFELFVPDRPDLKATHINLSLGK